MKREMQEEILKWMLGQVYRAEHHKKELEDRLERIVAEREAPIGSPGYEPLPRVMEPGAGAASILFKQAEIEERIYEQKAEIEKSLVRVMDIIDFIPQKETARRIFELRHLDCLNMTQTADAIPISRPQAYVIYNEAIDKLLEFPKIQKMVRDSEIEYCDWYVRKDEAERRRSKKQSGGIKPEIQNGNLKPGKKTGKRKRKK